VKEEDYEKMAKLSLEDGNAGSNLRVKNKILTFSKLHIKIFIKDHLY